MPRGRVLEPLCLKYLVNDDTGCWEWIRSKRGGYGLVYIGCKSIQAHVYIYEIETGLMIPYGAVLHHICRNRCCVNPKHMEVRTQRYNILDGAGVAAKRAAQTHCRYGHEFTQDNTYVTSKGCRVCRQCNRERNSANYVKGSRTKYGA